MSERHKIVATLRALSRTETASRIATLGDYGVIAASIWIVWGTAMHTLAAV
jgi:hypothetical protein